MRYVIIETPTGPFAVIEHEGPSGARLEAAWVEGSRDPRLRGGTADDSVQPALVDRLRAYFSGAPVGFDDVPTPEGPPFFARCWEACRAIPRGRTVSYADLARRAGGDSRSARAAGQAMRSNPLPVIVPCHRVLASGGRLGGFAGSLDAGGRALDTKRKLLVMEGALAADEGRPVTQGRSRNS